MVQLSALTLAAAAVEPTTPLLEQRISSVGRVWVEVEQSLGPPPAAALREDLDPGPGIALAFSLALDVDLDTVALMLMVVVLLLAMLVLAPVHLAWLCLSARSGIVLAYSPQRSTSASRPMGHESRTRIRGITLPTVAETVSVPAPAPAAPFTCPAFHLSVVFATLSTFGGGEEARTEEEDNGIRSAAGGTDSRANRFSD